MDSSRTRIASRRLDPVNSSAKINITSRRSLSSSSSFSSFSSGSSNSLVFSGDSPLNSPSTHLRVLGVPFSWEQLPGKPKDYSHSRNNESSNLLPLPPHRSTHFPTTKRSSKSINSTKKNSFPIKVRDPFAVALLECSKDEGNSEDDEKEEDREEVGNHSGAASKTLSKSSIGNKFGLVNLYGSCRRTCAVSESIVYLPRPGKAASYDHLLLSRRRR